MFKRPQLLKWLARDSNSDPCSRAREHGHGAAGSRERAECSAAKCLGLQVGQRRGREGAGATVGCEL